MNRIIARMGFAALVAVFGTAGSGVASAQSDPDGVSFTLEGCRNDGSIVLPNGSGKFVCPDSAYTTGNLGKGWNELDLVPFRITAKAGNSAPASQTYAVTIALDNFDAGKPGYDVLGSDAGGVPVLNTAKSDASCTALSATGQLIQSPGQGGIEKTIYRTLTITQPANTTCVYDWYGRLALGSHLFPGSSLHANLLNKDLGTAGIGSKEVSIPVKEILPQEISKTMSATQNAVTTWNVTKNATPGSLDFGDVCKAPAGPLEKGVQVTVTWTKLATSPSGDVTVVTNINAKNPASRTITVNVTDSIYKGLTKAGAAIATANSGDIDVGANFNGLLKTFTYTIPAASAGNIGDSLNDEAVATYTDKATGVPVPGNTTATATAQIGLGTTLNETANISDLESITGLGLSFKVADPGLPNSGFVGYTAGTSATSVRWDISGLTGSGSVTFDKTVVLDQRRITTGELTDSATLSSTDSAFTTSASLFPVGIVSSATVSLKVKKTIPLALQAGESIVVAFTVTPTGGGASTPVQVTFTGPSAAGASAESDPLTGLAPASYTVTEGSSTFYSPANPGGVAINLVPAPGQQGQQVDLSPKAGGIMDSSNCSGTATFDNLIPTGDFPTAKVQKITLPAQVSGDDGWEWTFTLTGPGSFVPEQIKAYAGQPAVQFLSSLTEEGTYTITETQKPPKWDLTGVIRPDGTSATTVCSFVVDFPGDLGKSFTCTFTNTKRGYVKVIKTLKGGPLTTEQFTFQLRQGATSNSDGTALETLTTNSGGNLSTLNFTTLLVPNTTYQMCEATQAGWMTSFNNNQDPYFVPGAFTPPGTTIPNPAVDNSWLCVNFSVGPGETKTFNVDNSPPPGGRALTIGYWKNHASCTSSSQKKEPALDKALYKYLPKGILTGTKIDSLVYADHTTFGLYGQNATSTADCAYAVSLLDKRNFNGQKSASDPLFNMAAQLVGAELNLAAGAYTCAGVVNTVTSAEALLLKYGFTGFGYSGKLSAADASSANTLAQKLDDYNNDRPGVCP